MLVAQLSDIHVRPRGQLYQGRVDSNRMFQAALDRLHALDCPPDLVVFSGDLVDEGRPEEYAMLRELLRPLRIPYLVLPGNHDERGALRAAFADHAYLPPEGPLHYCVDEHPLRIVAFDSCAPGLHHGQADAAGLAWLRRTLAADPHKPTLLLLHHPPFVSGIPYMDEYRCFDEAPLAEVVASFTNIEAVLCGHVHRPMFRRWAGTVAAACPSTTTEIALQLRADAPPRSFLGPPAFLLHRWAPGQGLVSHTVYVGPHEGPFDFF